MFYLRFSLLTNLLFKLYFKLSKTVLRKYLVCLHEQFIDITSKMRIVAVAISVHLQTVFYMIYFHIYAKLFNTQKLCILPYTQNKLLSFS